MKQLFSVAFVLVLACCGLMANAETKSEVPAVVEMTIKNGFKRSRPDVLIESIRPSVTAGIYEVKVANGPVLYSTSDGKYFILGDMFELAPGGFVNLAEKSREIERAETLATVKVEDMIVFSPAEQPAKASIVVFTDVDCGYCIKLHREVADLNRMGIEVRYMAFPRAGIGSQSYKKIASAWCAEDKQEALTKLKNRQRIPNNVCQGNPVEEHYELGNQIGVSGTPALVLNDGRLLPGYMPALRLAAALDVEVDPAIAAELRAKSQ